MYSLVMRNDDTLFNIVTFRTTLPSFCHAMRFGSSMMTNLGLL